MLPCRLLECVLVWRGPMNPFCGPARDREYDAVTHPVGVKLAMGTPASPRPAARGRARSRPQSARPRHVPARPQRVPARPQRVPARRPPNDRQGDVQKRRSQGERLWERRRPREGETATLPDGALVEVVPSVVYYVADGSFPLPPSRVQRGRLATAAFLFLPPNPGACARACGLTVRWPLQSGSSTGAIGAVA